jgi:glucokinase
MTALSRPKTTGASQHTIGVDVGGTKIAAGVVAPDGTIVKALAVPTSQSQDQIVECILAMVAELQSPHLGVAAVGVGAAGMVDWPGGRIRWAPNNSYKDLPLQHLLAEGSGLPTVVENDANAAAWAEATAGAGAGMPNVIALTIGTGIGAGIILNGELQRGDTGIAGEAGHIIVDPTGNEQCGCGATGCLEAMASGTALGRAGRRAAAADPAGRLAELAGAPENVTGETVHQAAREGDPTAGRLFDQIGYWLGIGLASLANIFDPQLMIVGGGLVATGDLLLAPTRRSFERFIFARAHRRLPLLVPARLGPDAGLIGAALLALHQCSGPARQVTTPAVVASAPGRVRPPRDTAPD